jgi:hypothetical protein
MIRLIGRLIGRMPFAPTQTKMRLIGRMPIDWANAIRPYGRNSTRDRGFCLCRRGFNRPVSCIMIREVNKFDNETAFPSK